MGAKDQRGGGEFLYGRQPVLEAMRARRRSIHRVYRLRSDDGDSPVPELDALAGEARVPVKQVSRGWFDNAVRGGNHQGVGADVSAYPYLTVDDLDRLVSKAELPFVLVLDHLEDPQNVGAILRTAEAVGVTAAVLSTRGAAGVTPAAVRASAGAAEHVKVCRASSVGKTVELLAQRGLRLVGLEAGESSVRYDAADLSGPLGLAVGSEGRGLSPRVRDVCDAVVELPLMGAVASLNASVAAGVALYEVLRCRDGSRD